MEAFVMNYDPDTDVVRVRTSDAPCDATAVPLEDLTILVSHELDQVVGLNIDDLPTFVKRYVADKLVPPGVHGQELFDAVERHLTALIQLFTRNLGPVAKDRVCHWDEFVSSVVKRAPVAEKPPLLVGAGRTTESE